MDILCIGTKFLFRAKQRATGPKFACAFVARDISVSPGVFSGLGAVKGEIHLWMQIIRQCTRVYREHQGINLIPVRVQELARRTVIDPPKPKGLVTFKLSSSETDFWANDMKQLLQIEVLTREKQTHCHDAGQQHLNISAYSAPGSANYLVTRHDDQENNKRIHVIDVAGGFKHGAQDGIHRSDAAKHAEDNDNRVPQNRCNALASLLSEMPGERHEKDHR